MADEKAQYRKAANELKAADPKLTTAQIREALKARGMEVPAGQTLKNAGGTRGLSLVDSAKRSEARNAQRSRRRTRLEQASHGSVPKPEKLPGAITEHLANQRVDIQGIGSRGDYTVYNPEAEALLKTQIENAHPGITVALGHDPTEMRLVKSEMYHPIVDPDTLPGLTVKTSDSLENILQLAQKHPSLKYAMKAAARATPVVAAAGVALDAAGAMAGTQQAVQAPTQQQRVSGALGAVASGLGLASAAWPPLAVPAMAAAGLSALAENRAAEKPPAKPSYGPAKPAQIVPTPPAPSAWQKRLQARRSK